MCEQKSGSASLAFRMSVYLLGVVLFLGVLVVVFMAIPESNRMRLREQESMAAIQLHRLGNAQLAYYQTKHTDEYGKAVPAQFAGPVLLEPGDPTLFMCQSGSPQPYVPNSSTWRHPVWRALDFSIKDALLFAYEVETSGTGKDAVFTVRAIGDLDCDGIRSAFERTGFVNAFGEPQMDLERPGKNTLE